MGIGHDDERMAQHGAKDGPAVGEATEQRDRVSVAGPPSVTNPERPA